MAIQFGQVRGGATKVMNLRKIHEGVRGLRSKDAMPYGLGHRSSLAIRTLSSY
jgi:hypothetical protein